MDADPIYLAPQDYAITWPLLGGFIIFALIIWCVCIWLFTRTPDPQERGGSLPPSALTKLRRDALRRIDEIDTAGADGQDDEQGEPPPRQTHHDHPPTTSRAAPADASKLGRSASAAPNCRG